MESDKSTHTTLCLTLSPSHSNTQTLTQSHRSLDLHGSTLIRQSSFPRPSSPRLSALVSRHSHSLTHTLVSSTLRRIVTHQSPPSNRRTASRSRRLLQGSRSRRLASTFKALVIAASSRFHLYLVTASPVQICSFFVESPHSSRRSSRLESRRLSARRSSLLLANHERCSSKHLDTVMYTLRRSFNTFQLYTRCCYGHTLWEKDHSRMRHPFTKG
ncbi:hypothetical protein PIB30_028187 [Stylosanthes scabra]|uniref:Uncharacterized protein n=1 Tax=Stylosanthes scabra TaxID=79078 RepID=A0ABU6QBI9_9FABA|nr:hypothetical protein [Stylosanthes scabra]